MEGVGALKSSADGLRSRMSPSWSLGYAELKETEGRWEARSRHRFCRSWPGAAGTKLRLRLHRLMGNV
jgi:hypothetical protein